jgi:predicted Zn finger-like uncharacterized protein
MSLITRCPACTTMFKVVQDQLRMSEGWVRCGQCNEVFDANAHLFHDIDSALAAPPPPPPPVQEPWVESLKFEPPSKPSFQPPPKPALAPEPEPEPTVYAPEDAHVDALLDQSPLELAGEEEPAAAPSFMTAGTVKKNDFWQRSSVRLALAAFSVFLIGLLCVQFMVHERDRLAASSPVAKQFFVGACAALGCTVSPLRQIQSVVIDSSSFVKVRGEVYRLQFTLKNSGPVEVAVPAMELTLTDLQDQPVVRKVLLPVEYGAKTDTLTAGGELSAMLPLGAKLSANERISGYRLLAFYP